MNSNIQDSLAEIAEISSQQTDGKWLEHLTPRCATLIADWHVSAAWHWDEWPDREKKGYGKDIGIDAVATRAGDGKLIAIQCKSRKLNEHGRGNNITKDELDKFLSTSARPIWAERWVVVIGDTRLSSNAETAAGPEKPLKTINIESDLRKQLEYDQSAGEEPCQHCTEEGGTQTRDCMQREAIDKSVTLLQKHAEGGVIRMEGLEGVSSCPVALASPVSRYASSRNSQNLARFRPCFARRSPWCNSSEASFWLIA